MLLELMNRPADPNAPPLTLDVLESAFRELWDAVAPSSTIMISIPVRDKIRLWHRWHNGVRVKGCRGTVTVRFRNDRYEVVR